MTAKTPTRVFADESVAPRVAIFARGPQASDLTGALERQGVRAATIGPDSDGRPPLRSRVAARAALARAKVTLSGIDALIYAWVDPEMAQRAPIDAMSEAQWIARCEKPLTHARTFFQTAYEELAERGGSLILLLPSLAMTGSDLLLPWAAAAEGQRSLAKATARAWGRCPIRINCLAASAALLAGVDADTPMERAGLPAQSLTTPEPGWDAIAALAATMLTPGFASVTGTTIGADNGRWMTP